MKLDFESPHLCADPWGYTSSWYEQRRRQLTAALLPHQDLGEVLEIGCSIGLITALLAPRARRFVAVDISAAALEKARETTAAFAHVELVHAPITEAFTHQLVGARFDTVLLCDVGYYLQEADLFKLANGIRQCLKAPATVMLAHWRHKFDAQLTSTARVHELLQQELGLHVQICYQDKDLLVHVLSDTDISLAQKEGLA